MPQTNVTHSHRSIYIVSPYMCSSSSQQSLHYSNICRLIFIVVVIVRVMVLKLDFRVGSFGFFDSRKLFDAFRFIPEIPRYISIHFDTFRYISIHFSHAYFYYQKAPDTFRYISIHFDTFSIHFFIFMFFFLSFFCDPPSPLCRCMCGGAAVCAAMPLDAGNNMFAFLQFVQRHVLMRVSRLLRHALQHKSSKGVQ